MGWQHNGVFTFFEWNISTFETFFKCFDRVKCVMLISKEISRLQSRFEDVSYLTLRCASVVERCKMFIHTCHKQVINVFFFYSNCLWSWGFPVESELFSLCTPASSTKIILFYPTTNMYWYWIENLINFTQFKLLYLNMYMDAGCV